MFYNNKLSKRGRKKIHQEKIIVVSSRRRELAADDDDEEGWMVAGGGGTMVVVVRAHGRDAHATCISGPFAKVETSVIFPRRNGGSL